MTLLLVIPADALYADGFYRLIGSHETSAGKNKDREKCTEEDKWNEEGQCFRATRLEWLGDSTNRVQYYSNVVCERSRVYILQR